MSASCTSQLSESFRANAAAIFPQFLQAGALPLFQCEAKRILDEAGRRRDLLMPHTNNTPRRMTTVNAKDIALLSTLIPMFYNDPTLLRSLSTLVGDDVFPAPDPLESFTCKLLHRASDIHGAHVDTYPYTLTTVLEAPVDGNGGVLEYVPRSTSIADLATDKKRSIALRPGGAYVMRTDTSIHQVTQLRSDDRRLVLVFSYADAGTRETMSYSSAILHS